MRRLLVSAVLVTTFVIVPAAPASAQYHYAAMGDSYSSGTGTREYYNETCERSFFAYPERVYRGWPLSDGRVSLYNRTCGGATTDEVIERQVPAIPRHATHISITIGGNDADFGKVIRDCIFGGCQRGIDDAQRYIRYTLPNRLGNVYSRIRQRAPFAQVFVIGYPRIFQIRSCNGAPNIETNEQKRLNETAEILAAVTQWMTASAGHAFYFIDSDPAFAGHRVCSSDEWINGLSDPIGESFHPDRDGHRKALQPILGWTIAAAG
jgi:lysophospholipase L1-like esterase